MQSIVGPIAGIIGAMGAAAMFAGGPAGPPGWISGLIAGGIGMFAADEAARALVGWMLGENPQNPVVPKESDNSNLDLRPGTGDSEIELNRSDIFRQDLTGSSDTMNSTTSAFPSARINKDGGASTNYFDGRVTNNNYVGGSTSVNHSDNSSSGGGGGSSNNSGWGKMRYLPFGRFGAIA